MDFCAIARVFPPRNPSRTRQAVCPYCEMCVIGSNAYAGRVAYARKKTQGTMNRGMAAALLRDIIMLLRPNPVRIRHPKLPPAEQTSVHGVRARTDHDKRRSNAGQEPGHSET